MKTNSAPRHLLGACLGLWLGAASQAADDIAGRFPDLKRDPGGYWTLNFGQLASDSAPLAPPAEVNPLRGRSQLHAFFAPPRPIVKTPDKPGSTEGVPDMVVALDGHHVRITGFMLPTKTKGERVTEFLLLGSQLTCCYGIPPGPYEWVVVSAPEGFPQRMDVPSDVYGTLHVGAMFDGPDFAGIYRLDAEKIFIP